MARDGEEAVGVDRRLPMFCGDDDGGRIQETLVFQRSDHLPDCRIHELDLVQHYWPRCTSGVFITAGVSVGSDSRFGMNQLFSNADRLEVHTEDHRDRSL